MLFWAVLHPTETISCMQSGFPTDDLKTLCFLALLSLPGSQAKEGNQTISAQKRHAALSCYIRYALWISFPGDACLI